MIASNAGFFRQNKRMATVITPAVAGGWIISLLDCAERKTVVLKRIYRQKKCMHLEKKAAGSG
jgi:hypothetical protein